MKGTCVVRDVADVMSGRECRVWRWTRQLARAGHLARRDVAVEWGKGRGRRAETSWRVIRMYVVSPCDVRIGGPYLGGMCY